MRAIHRLTDAELHELLEHLAGDQRTQALGWRVRECRLSEERFPERNYIIRERRRKGATLGQLSRDYGLSRSRIRDICRQILCVPDAHTHPLTRYPD
jgi:hypothetical protein